MLSVALFDLNGTLVDTEHFSRQAVESVMADYFDSNIDEDELRAHTGIKHRERIIQMLAQRGIDDDEVVEKLHAEVKKHFEESYTVHRAVVPGAPEFLQNLHDAGIRMAIVSSYSHAGIEQDLAETGLTNFFEYICGYDDVRAPKPHPEPYEKTLADMGVTTEEAVVFEDSPPGVEAARLAGLPVIGLLSTFTPDDLAHTIHTMHDYTQINYEKLQSLLA